MIASKLTNFWASGDAGDRRLIVKYAILTAAVFLPLVWAFLSVRNVYPIPSWNLMMAGGDLERGHTYCILRGETVSGETINIPPIGLTNAMYSRTWSMVNATINNQSFKLASIHPANAELIQHAGGVEKLPAGARIPDLLETWGRLYNERLPGSSPQRLKSIRLDRYRWEGGSYSNYQNFIESWRKEL
ncbi:MAG TPA: hypothetical protein VFS76_03480 [Pyrinomonadaceae bacterium]|nr:hypothetical protein [Pyrinomonadaceae bacterium]